MTDNTTFRNVLRSTGGYRHVSIADVSGVITEIVIVDGDGNLVAVQHTEPVKYSSETGIEAGTTQTQALATALTEEWNNVTVCATDGDGAKLMTAVAGFAIWVKNSGAASLAVYPNTSDSINAMAVNLAINIPPGGLVCFRAISDTVWETPEVLVSTAPSTQKGEFVFKAVDNDGDTKTTLSNAAMGQASVISIPDPGAATANVVLTDQANDGVLVTATAAEINTSSNQSVQQLTAGAGITDGTSTLHHSFVEKRGGIFYTYLYVDLTSLKSSTTDGDIIGVEGADVVVNGSYATDSDWSYGADWSFDTNKADCAPGTGTVMEPAAALTVVTGATYEVTYTMSSFSAGTCVVSIGGTNGTSRGSDATFVERIVAGDTTNLKFTGDSAGDYQVDDVIVKRVSPAYLGQITAALNGTLFRSCVTWLETPTTGADDINFWSATEATGLFDDAITGLTQTSLYDKTSAAAAAINTRIDIGIPAVNQYLYLAAGEASVPGTYDAGIFILEFWGA